MHLVLARKFLFISINCREKSRSVTQVFINTSEVSDTLRTQRYNHLKKNCRSTYGHSTINFVSLCSKYMGRWVRSDEESTTQVNVVAPSLVAQVAATFGVKVVLFSTDYVFDGRSGPYLETDDVCPVNVYGHSKLKAEELILDVCPSALIIRTTVVYGPEDAGKNFAYQICTRLSQGETVQCITDQFSTPTYNRDLAEMTVRLANEDCFRNIQLRWWRVYEPS